jgi:hypothetical protein
MNARNCVGGVLFAGALAWLTAPRLASQAPSFVAGCTMPFQGDAHDIDDKCSREGDPSGGPEGKLQNQFKTNYCATGGPIEVTDVTLRALQLAADTLKQQGHLHYGSPTNEPHLS